MRLSAGNHFGVVTVTPLLSGYIAPSCHWFFIFFPITACPGVFYALCVTQLTRCSVTPKNSETSRGGCMIAWRALCCKGVSQIKDRFSAVMHRSDAEARSTCIGLRRWITIRLNFLFWSLFSNMLTIFPIVFTGLCKGFVFICGFSFWIGIQAWLISVKSRWL